MNQIRLIPSWVLLLLITIAQDAFSQLHQPYRFEQVVKNSEEGFTVISLKKEGLALIRDMHKFAEGKKKWQLEIVDTVLTKVWSTELELESRLILVGYEYNLRHLYLLFREGESDYYNFRLLTVLFYEKKIQTNEIKFEVNFKMTHFTMAGSSAIFGGNVSNEPAVLLYSQSSNHTKVLPGLFIRDISLLDVRTNQNQSFNVLLAERKGKEKKRLVVRTYDQDGNLLMDDIINIDGQFSILTGLTSTLESDEMIIAGTYGDPNGKQALGYYSVVVDPFNEQLVTYTDFSSLNHFLDYLSPRRADKIKAKTRKQKTLGRQPDYKAYVVPFRIEERPKGFYLLSELYYPSSSVNPYPYGSNYYNPNVYGYYPYGMSPFSTRYFNNYPYGYSTVRNTDVRMVQTMVTELDLHGKPGKDVTLKLNEIKQSSLEQVGDFVILRDSICIVYKKEEDIFYQKESGDPDEKPSIKQTKVRLQNENDVLKNENEFESQVRFWYGHHFYVWGYQTIKDTTREGDQTRHVFYVNRFSME